MRMIVAALIAGIVIGFVDAKFLMAQIHELVTDPGLQPIVTTGVAAFLGALWGWLAKGLLGSKSKD
jgi:hypothetical protein